MPGTGRRAKRATKAPMLIVSSSAARVGTELKCPANVPSARDRTAPLARFRLAFRPSLLQRPRPQERAADSDRALLISPRWTFLRWPQNEFVLASRGGGRVTHGDGFAGDRTSSGGRSRPELRLDPRRRPQLLGFPGGRCIVFSRYRDQCATHGLMRRFEA